MAEPETHEKLRKNPYPVDKWMFTVVLVDWDGQRARELDGVTYSTRTTSRTSDV
jgi:hypothetical protein